MKRVKYIVQAVSGLALSVGVMFYRGIAGAESGADRVMIICDGFTVTALLFLAVGILIWIAGTGFFDIFGYAVRKGAHALFPGLVHDNLAGYYEYKTEKKADKERKGEHSTLIIGAVFLLISIILTAVWYRYSI